MNRRSFSLLLVLIAVLALVPLAAWAQTQAGAIKAVHVSGSVQKVAADGTAIPLAEGQSLVETDTVATGADSSVVLVFMNGSSMKLAANTRLAIEEFKMDPLGDNIHVADLKHEPSVSKTRLNLAYGEMVGNVKKLNTTQGSSFDIRTPVGAAGIRGTTFRIVLQFQPNGQVAFQLSTAEGSVVFNGTVQVATSGATSQDGTANAVNVTEGQEVSAVATVNPATNQVTSVQVSAAQSISPAATQAITSAVTQAIQQAQQSTTFTPTEQQQAAQQTSTPTPTAPTSSDTKPEPKSEPKINVQPQVTPQTPITDVTTRSGSG